LPPCGTIASKRHGSHGEAFQAYVETQLVKTLKPGDIVILDNLGPA